MRGIYALIDPESARDPAAFAAAIAGAGVRIVQVRAKRGIDRAQLAAIVRAVRERGAAAIVNDDVELALAADGVHLGQEDAALHDLAAVRRKLGARLIGLSCGTPGEARAIDRGIVDYIGVGPMFATASKGDAGRPIGVSGVRAVAAASAVPAAAIGGIDLARIGRVRETGVAMAAVLSALREGGDPAATARRFVQAWNA